MFCFDSEVGDILIVRDVLFITYKVNFSCLYLVRTSIFGLDKSVILTALRIFLILNGFLILYLS